MAKSNGTQWKNLGTPLWKWEINKAFNQEF